MEISRVVLMNFKPYFGMNEVDLSVNPEQNIILIGGKNGQGKTSFLVGLVWCVYGERISKVDATFHQEVKGNYQKFLQSALNRSAETQGVSNFSVAIQFSNVELAEIFSQPGQQGSEVMLVRSYDTKSGVEDFKILVDGQETELVSDEQGKVNFVDDYLVPAEAAKFVFFDAEKIADIAEMNIREQGRIMNTALGNILGLSKYEDTIDQLYTYIRDLKVRKETRSNITTQIESFENKLRINAGQIESTQLENEELDEKIKAVERNMADYERYLIRGGAKVLNIEIEKLEDKKKRVDKELQRLGERLKEISEIIPFAISAGKIQELVAHLEVEQAVAATQNSDREIKAKTEEFIEALFEQPEFPPEGDMKTLQKAFYIHKAKNLFPKIFGQNDEENQLTFFHDLPKSAIQHIQAVYNTLQAGDEQFNHIFSDYIRIQNEFDDIKNQLNKAKAKTEDETFTDYREKLEEAKREYLNLGKKKGENESLIHNLQIDTDTVKERLKNLLDKVEVSKQEQIIIDEVNRHIAALNEFIETEKKAKCESLKNTLVYEMQRLMHKKDLIDAVAVEILPDKGGLEVTLMKNGREVPKNLLSTGEKQIYISCLLKAILKEAVSDYPVFIDTPLGRLDREHKDSFVDTYYPELAYQVVLFSTDEEVTPRRYDRIAAHVAQKFMLNNTDNITKIVPGYFDL
ncbi:MAG: DNA sulfur modification protein DndD [Saprospiraceae bacterium]|nr:DNA sulfur modification protein DndD [Saprospiraceae bacterium]